MQPVVGEYRKSFLHGTIMQPVVGEYRKSFSHGTIYVEIGPRALAEPDMLGKPEGPSVSAHRKASNALVRQFVSHQQMSGVCNFLDNYLYGQYYEGNMTN